MAGTATIYCIMMIYCTSERINKYHIPLFTHTLGYMFQNYCTLNTCCISVRVQGVLLKLACSCIAPSLQPNAEVHCKKRFVVGFPVPSRDVTDQTLPGREYFNYSRPGMRVCLVTSRLGMGKSITFF
jgi:hypothetical protein